MKSESRIVELLSEMTLKQDQMLEAMQKQQDEQKKTNVILNQHERDLHKIAELLSEGVPKYDSVVELENIGGKKVIIRKG